MKDEKPKYADRADRMRKFLESVPYGSKSELAALLGIRNQHINNYLTGTQDPMNLCVELQNLGMDLNYLATGKGLEEDKSGITSEDIRILIELRLHGVDTVAEVRKLIELRDTMKRMLQTEIRAEPNPLYTEQEQRRYLDNPEFKTKSAVKKEKKTKEHHKS